MKKKWLAGLLILAVLSAFAGGGAALAFAQTNDALGEVKVTNVQYSTAWEMIVVKTDSHTNITSWTSGDATHISLKDRAGNPMTIQSVLLLTDTGDTIDTMYIDIGRDTAGDNDVLPELGAVLTVEEGCAFGTIGEFKRTVSYICQNAPTNTFWVEFAPTALTAMEDTLSIMENREKPLSFVLAGQTTDGSQVTYSDVPVTYTIADPEIATVEGTGPNATVTGVKAGTTTLTATCHGFTETVEITVEESLTLDRITVEGKISVYKGLTEIPASELEKLIGTMYFAVAEGDPKTETFAVAADMLSGDYDLATPDTYTITVTVEGKTATFELEVKELKTAAVISVYYSDDSYGKYLLIQMTDNCNDYRNDNGKDTAMKAYLESHVTLVNEKGENILLLAETWGTCIALNRTAKDADGNPYAFTVKEGYIFTLKQGMRWVNEEVKKDISYICTSAPYTWVEFAPTALTADEETLSIMEGNEKELSFALVRETDGDPVLYPTVPVSFEIADTEIATVTGDGRVAKIVGVKTGTTTLTATYGNLTKTVTITVTESLALKSIAVEGTLELYTRTGVLTDENLAVLTGKASYGTGDVITVEDDFIVKTDMLSGDYDLTAAGTYTLTVTYKEKTCSLTLTVKSCEAIQFTEVRYLFDWTKIVITTDTDFDVPDTWADGDAARIAVRDSAGNPITIVAASVRNKWIYVDIGKVPEAGVVITFLKGWRFSESVELKETESYICITAQDVFEVYNPAVHDVTKLTITNDPADNTVRINAVKTITWELNEGAVATPRFSSSDETVATVDENGNVVGISEGTAIITVRAGSQSATYTVEVKDALDVKGVELVNSYKIWVEKGAKAVLPADFTARVVFDDPDGETFGQVFELTAENATLAELDTTQTGTYETDLVIVYNEREYTVKAAVEVFEVSPMQVKELVIVDWFMFYTFVHYPNSSINTTNILDAATIPDAFLYEYTRADGTIVQCNTVIIDGGSIAIAPAFADGNMDLDSFNKAPYYMKGDRFVLKKGLTGYCWTGKADTTPSHAPVAGTGMIIRECVLEQDVIYEFDGSVWQIYVPYTDLQAPESVTVVLGERVSLRAFRVPDNATDGVFSYEVADETIAKMAMNGRITGLKIGTTTVTVTLSGGEAGTKTATITVNVVDGVLSLDLGIDSVLTVKQGTEKLDLSGLNAALVYASGKRVTVDLSNAEIIGYNKDTLGKTEVTVMVTVDGETYQAQLAIEVIKAKKGCGCGSGLTGAASALTALGALALAAAAVAISRRKSRAQK